MTSSSPYLFVFVLLTYLSYSFSKCPAVCRCTLGDVECMDAELMEIPSTLRVTGGMVDLSFNYLRHLSESSLKNFTSLKTLKLYHNELLSIGPNTFSHLTKLNLLDIGTNNLTSLSSEVFEGLEKLETLYMDTNNINYIGPLVFLPTTKLKKLDLQWNQITANIMEDLYLPSSLRQLNLAYNNLVAVKESWWQQLVDLSHLYLGGNPIVQLTSLSFGVMPSLSVLHLGNEELNFIDMTTFRRMFTLSFFSLSSSSFQYLPVSQLRDCYQTLQSIVMSGSPVKEITSRTFSDFPSLNTINLVNLTFLHVIRKQSFYNLTSLQYLAIKKCRRLVWIEHNSFAHLSKLLSVDLSDNNLIALSDTLFVFSQLNELRITGNKWRCDCKIQELHANLQNFTIEQSFETTFVCNSPQLVKGLRLFEALIKTDLCSAEVISAYSVDPVTSVIDINENRTSKSEKYTGGAYTIRGSVVCVTAVMSVLRML